MKVSSIKTAAGYRITSTINVPPKNSRWIFSDYSKASDFNPNEISNFTGVAVYWHMGEYTVKKEAALTELIVILKNNMTEFTTASLKIEYGAIGLIV